MAIHNIEDERPTYDLRAIRRVKPSDEKLESYTMEHLPLNTLQIDRSYQRELDHARVKGMVDTFSPALLLPFAVNIRDDGSSVTVDGQHRTAMLAALGKGDARVACAVYRGLTVEEEAWLFDELNKRQKKLTPLQQYRGAVAAGQGWALEIKSAVESAGFVIRPEQRDLSRSNIPGIAALKKARKQYGHDRMTKALHLIADTWGTEHGPCADIILYVTDFIYRYEGTFNVKRFVRMFSKIDPAMMTKEVKVNKVSGGMSFETAWNFKLVETYNKGAREDHQLPTIIELRAQRSAAKGIRHA